MVELLKQPQYAPLNVVDQILSIFAGTQGYLDDVPVNEVAKWEADFLKFVKDQRREVWNLIDTEKNESDTLKSEEHETTKAVRAAIEEFKQQGKKPGSEAA
jgi:F-type H+-transporting ATPase subunit alpha